MAFVGVSPCGFRVEWRDSGGAGRGLKDVARIPKVPRATLRRRLDEAGRWPVDRPAA